MTKYLESERFLVTSNDKDARRRYNENYDRIFGDASGSSQDVEARSVAPGPEAPADPCDVCGAQAGEWCKHGCSEGPAQPKP